MCVHICVYIFVCCRHAMADPEEDLSFFAFALLPQAEQARTLLDYSMCGPNSQLCEGILSELYTSQTLPKFMKSEGSETSMRQRVVFFK